MVGVVVVTDGRRSRRRRCCRCRCQLRCGSRSISRCHRQTATITTTTTSCSTTSTALAVMAHCLCAGVHSRDRRRLGKPFTTTTTTNAAVDTLSAAAVLWVHRFVVRLAQQAAPAALAQGCARRGRWRLWRPSLRRRRRRRRRRCVPAVTHKTVNNDVGEVRAVALSSPTPVRSSQNMLIPRGVHCFFFSPLGRSTGTEGASGTDARDAHGVLREGHAVVPGLPP